MLMLRRLMSLLLCLALCLPSLALAQEEELKPIFRVQLKSETTLRTEPDKNGSRIVKIPRHVPVDVYEYGDEWCYCGYNGKTGYMLTKQLYEFWRLADQDVPNFQRTVGIARMTATVEASNEEYTDPTTLEAGDVVALLDASGVAPMYRSTFTLPEGSFDYEPFVPVEQSVPGDLISAFSTWYDGSPSHRLYINRIVNIELACSRVNGVTLLPGEQYSMNTTIGPYSKSNGYKEAPTTGASPSGYGGGTCQVTTTLFSAILGLYGMQIDVWNVHSRDGAKYVPLNMDALVSGSSDLVFTNTYDFPVTFRMDCRGGVMTVLVYHGTEAEVPELAF